MPADDESYYSAHTNTVAVLYGSRDPARPAAAGRSFVGTETWRISHEVGHQMSFNTGLQTRGVLYPLWVSEGLATSFETASLTTGGFAAANPPRQRRLAAAGAQGRLRGLDEMAVLATPPPGGEACLDVYAQSWGMVQFLFARDPQALRRYLYTLALRPAGKRPPAALRAEFEGAFGRLAEVQVAWDAFVAAAAPAAL